MTHMLELFIRQVAGVSAGVLRVNNRAEALDRTLEICRDKPVCQSWMDGVTAGDKKVVAAPNLDGPAWELFSEKCRKAGDICLIRENVRAYPGGIDVGVTRMDFGIADTGTLVLNSNSEDTRLATMLAEIHVAILDVSDIRETALAMSDELKHLVEQPGAYTAFITGASRTADIERVLAIGVHGPLELVIILVENG